MQIIGPGGDQAGVNSRGMLSVISWRSSEAEYIALTVQEVWRFATNSLALTAAAGESSVMYVLNGSPDRDFIISDFNVSGQSGATIRIYENPTGGTILTQPLVGARGVYFGTTKSFFGEFRIGADGITQTGSVFHTSQELASVVGGGDGSTDIVILPPGDAAVLTVNPSTDGAFSVSAAGYYPLELPR